MPFRFLALIGFVFLSFSLLNLDRKEEQQRQESHCENRKSSIFFAALAAPQINWKEIQNFIRKGLTTEQNYQINFESYMHISLAFNMSSPDPVLRAVSLPEICIFPITLGNYSIYKHRNVDVLHVVVNEDKENPLTRLHNAILYFSQQKWKYSSW